MKKIFFNLIIILFISSIYAQERPIIQNINSKAQDLYKIKITWTIPETSSPAIDELHLYRDTKQITSYEQIDNLKAIAVLNKDSTSYSDTLPDTLEYYYCIIAKTKDGPYKIIIPSINSTIDGVIPNHKIVKSKIKNEPYPKKSELTTNSVSNRTFPLPAIKINGNIDAKDKKIELGEKAIEAGKQLAFNYDSKNFISSIHVFEEDLICPEGGDEYFLFKILKDTFVKNDFSNSIKNLEDFLSIHRSKETTNRALFYLAESYYFLGDYENAIYNFLAVKDIYPELTKMWLDSSLDLYEIN